MTAAHHSPRQASTPARTGRSSGPPKVMFVRGRGPSCGTTRAAVPRLPLRPGRPRSATPTPWWPRRSPSRPDAAPRLVPLRHPVADRGGRRHRRADRRRRAGVLLQLGRRGERGRLQGGPEVRWPRPSRGLPPTAASTVERSPRSPPPDSRPSTSRSRRCRTASATWPQRPRRARGGHRRDGRRHPPRAHPGRGRRHPRPDRLPRGRAGARDERNLADPRRGADRPRPHRALVRLPPLRRPAPTSSAWPRRSATACRSGRAGPPRCAAVLQPGDHGSTYSGTPSPDHGGSGEPSGAAAHRRTDAGAAGRARLQRLLLSTPGVTDVRGRDSSWRPSWTVGTPSRFAAACLERGLVLNDVDAPTALASRHP